MIIKAPPRKKTVRPVQIEPFSPGICHFLAAKEPALPGEGYNFKIGCVCESFWGIYEHAPQPPFGAKDVYCYIRYLIITPIRLSLYMYSHTAIKTLYSYTILCASASGGMAGPREYKLAALRKACYLFGHLFFSFSF